MFLFLGVRTGVIVATLIPTTIVLTFILMTIFDQSLNQVTLAALIKTELPYLDIPVLKRCQFLMKPNGIFYRRIKSIEGALKEDHIVIHYRDFMNKPEETVERIYKYMGLKFKGVRTTNLDDYEIKGIKYRDVVLDDFPFQDRHTLKKDKIKEEKINPKDYLPLEIYKQFKDADIL